MPPKTTDSPPRPERKAKILEAHGQRREDPYYWLKDRENPDVIDHLQKENLFVDQFFKRNEKLIEDVFAELKSRTAEEEESAPVDKGDFTYWSRFEKGREHPIYMRKHKFTKDLPRVILDENELAKGKEFLECTGPMVSPQQDWMAYAVDTEGRRFYTVSFKNLESGEISPRKIEKVTGDVVWAQDNETLFYTRQDPQTLRSYQVYRFHLPTGKTTLVYEEKDPEFSLNLSKSLSEKFIFLNISHLQTDEVRYLPADRPAEDFQIFRPRKKGVSDALIDGGNFFFLLTNEGAPNKKLFQVPYSAKSTQEWVEILPHRQEVFLVDVDAIAGQLILTERQNAQDRVRIIDVGTAQSRYLRFDDPAYMVAHISQGEFQRDSFRIMYQSQRVPRKIIDVKIKDLSQHLVLQKPVPNFHSENYKTERLWIAARDGKKIPVSLVMKKDFQPDGSSPLMQYAYGSYGYGMPPGFSLSALSLVDRGFVYAIAHVRGGDELGRAWYDEGRMKNKMNTFTDFIDVTEGLIQKGYAKKDRIYARGGSAGGLLMGVIANLRPDLYHGIIAEVPFVDVLTTMLDDSIPLTTFEYEEWGNPHIKDQYDWMRAYSPYDNVKKQSYPHMLVRTGLHDSQVQYWEPAKWVARLRDSNTSSSSIFLATHMDAGHGGVTGRYKELKEEAETLSFALSQL
jgi:oligopeptidase B